MIKHVVWDWNGTLVDDVSLCVDILNHVLVAHMKPRISVDSYRRKFFFPVAKFYESLELPSFGIEYEKLANDYIKEYRNRFSECMLHSRALETLEVLNELSISQSILTAGEQEDVESFACFFKVKQWVQWIDGASNIEAHGKEDRAAAHISKLELDPKDVLLVGDTLHDHEIANLIGCNALLYSRGHVDAERLRQLTGTVITSLYDVIKWVRD
jgi:phosphoglycolate phosphatase